MSTSDFNESLLLLEWCFGLNWSESPHGGLIVKTRFVVALNVLERYYTSYDTVKAPLQALFSVDLGCFFKFKKFAVVVAHVRKV